MSLYSIPTDFPDWCVGNSNNAPLASPPGTSPVSAPSGTKRTDGFQAEEPSCQHWNWLEWMHSSWVRWFWQGWEQVTSVTANYTVAANIQTVFGNPTSASFAVTLPDATTVAGMKVKVKNTAIGSANVVNLTPASGQQIEQQGSNTVVPIGAGEYLFVQSDGTTWWIVGQG